ncbi:Trans-2-enoyl-CoA reductase, mitochondrial [Pteropus alecto]|uniref:Trans-2-enoyl-CoA reductase, mitochondrial n=1 Tax=Pteropus alecto TaxID=9402 RepID=L5JUR6_PTEAL|nr:Trans-2-enoyl-CoA reductase, mitochondrial [Pteropus alecto]
MWVCCALRWSRTAARLRPGLLLSAGRCSPAAASYSASAEPSQVQALVYEHHGHPTKAIEMVSLTTLLELCRNSSVCGIDGIPRGRLGLVSLVRRSWTNTPPPRRAACVRPACRPHPPVFAASTFHLLDPRPWPTLFPSHFCEFQLVPES